MKQLAVLANLIDGINFADSTNLSLTYFLDVSPLITVL